MDLNNITTPIKADILAQLLEEANYNKIETDYLVSGFRCGFDLEYCGPWKRSDVANNLPFRNGVGSPAILWEKMIKEVKLGRFASPFSNIPYKYFVQSPVGLVPKDGGKQTRLIFHLSYDFEEFESVNAYIPHEKCTVQYRDLDHAIKQCLVMAENNKTIYFAICDLKSAFRLVPLKKSCWPLLIMKARNPQGFWKYFVDKCFPFGAASSCAIFQRFSNALAFLHRHRCYKITYTAQLSRSQIGLSNYLDDFLHFALSKLFSNKMVKMFQQLCDMLGVPISADKTVWATVRLVFLGILLDGQ